MSNEEKATIEYPKKQAKDVTYYFDVNEQKRKIFIKACEWKDQQFKEYLEKKREGVRMEIEKCSRNTVKEYSLVMVRENFDEIINELFPNTEQDNTDRDE